MKRGVFILIDFLIYILMAISIISIFLFIKGFVSMSAKCVLYHTEELKSFIIYGLTSSITIGIAIILIYF